LLCTTIMVFPDISLYWIIISQIIGVVAIVCYFISWQQKEKRELLMWLSAGNLLSATMFAIVGLHLIAIFRVIAFLRNITFYYTDKHRDNLHTLIPLLILFVFFALAGIGAYLTWTTPYDAIVLATFLLFIYGLWMRGTHLAKLTRVAYALALFIPNLLILNFMGMAIELTLILSTIIFYIRLHKQRKNKQQESEQTKILPR